MGKIIHTFGLERSLNQSSARPMVIKLTIGGKNYFFSPNIKTDYDDDHIIYFGYGCLLSDDGLPGNPVHPISVLFNTDDGTFEAELIQSPKAK
jgi:hypothetical protein